MGFYILQHKNKEGKKVVEITIDRQLGTFKTLIKIYEKEGFTNIELRGPFKYAKIEEGKTTEATM